MKDRVEKNRTADYQRYQRYRHINRKKRIIHDQNDYWKYKFEGELSKGKIHCSCWLCSFHGMSMSDIRKYDRMRYDLIESGVESRFLNTADTKITSFSNSKYYGF